MTLNTLVFAGFLLGQPGGDELHFPQPLANLGELRTYQTCDHRFEFVNRGTRPIDIIACEPSCGCMIASLPNRRILPGEKGNLTVEVKPTSQPTGPHSWFVKVRYRSKDGGEEIAQVQIQATIRQEISVTPSVLAWNGSGNLKQEFVLTDLRQPPLAVKEVHFSSVLANAQVVSSDKGITRIQLQTVAAVPPRRHDEVLSIFTDDPVYRVLQIPVTLTGQVTHKIAVTPEQVVHRLAENEPVPSTLVRLRPIGEGALAIKQVSTDDSAIRCVWAAGPLNGATLKIHVDAKRLGPGNLNSAVRVELVEPPGETVVIPVQVVRP